VSNRRDFIGLLGGAAAVWPLAARAEQRKVPVIGAFHAASREGTAHLMAAYREGLKEQGYVEGLNVAIEYRWANGVLDRMPAIMAELVRLQPDVITAFGTAARVAHDARAAGAAENIPIVFSIGIDPIVAGFVTNLNHPSGNMTGTTSLGLTLAPKRVEILHELVPSATKLALLENPTDTTRTTEMERQNIEAAAGAVGWQFEVVRASSVGEFDAAFAKLVQDHVGALIIGTDTFFYSEITRLASLVLQHALPAAGPLRDFPAAGGLMSYSASIPSVYRQAGIYTGKVLNGVKPVDLPVLQPTRFELVINLKTAKTLGLAVPLTLQVAADEVIE
jgi:putative ABC transport system substrate-binding protein